MTLGTIFTLLVIPSIYVLIAKQHAAEEYGSATRDFDAVESAENGLPLEAEAAAK